MLAVLFCITLPLTMLFSGCGATATNGANAVNFVSEKYDSKGRAIFEVDLGVPTKLNYKVNPSTWSGYAVTYNNDATERNRQRFVLEGDGVITVTRADFEDLDVEINVNGHSDHCLVTLKKYPTKVYPKFTEVQLAAQGMYTIDVLAEFEGENNARQILESDYKFKVVSSDETKVQVPNSDRLTIYAVCTNEATANVTVSLLDQSGKEKTKFVVKINVIQSAGKAVLKLGGVDKFIKEGETITLQSSSLETQSGAYVIIYNVLFFSDTNILLENNIETLFSFSDSSIVSADYSENKILIQINDITKNDYSFNVSLVTNLTDSSGKPLKLSFKIEILA